MVAIKKTSIIIIMSCHGYIGSRCIMLVGYCTIASWNICFLDVRLPIITPLCDDLVVLLTDNTSSEDRKFANK